ncbi:hypothetical protein EC991_008084 [Linnemannia zychae]|nr:hypothetical protein EC991_008084 [Linnemannia zychae]
MHGRCIKITKRTSIGIDTYYCPRCRPPAVPDPVSIPVPNVIGSLADVKKSARLATVSKAKEASAAATIEAKEVKPATSRIKKTTATVTVKTTSKTKETKPAATKAKELKAVTTKTKERKPIMIKAKETKPGTTKAIKKRETKAVATVATKETTKSILANTAVAKRTKREAIKASKVTPMTANELSTSPVETEPAKTTAKRSRKTAARTNGASTSVEIEATKSVATRNKLLTPGATTSTSTASGSRKRKQDLKPVSSSTSASASVSSTTSNPPPSKRRKTAVSGTLSALPGTTLTLPEIVSTATEMEQSEISRPSPAFVNVIQTSGLLKLSDEVLLWILIWVHCQKSICRVSGTCKRLWSIAQDPYLWKYITLHHDTMLRRHWDTLLHPRLLSSNIYELNLVGEVSSPVLIDTLKLELFTGLRALRLEDIQTYTVYRLASKLPWLKVFEARKIKGNSDRWDWSPFRNLTQLEELLLWRNEKPMQTFSLSEDLTIETPDDLYPQDGLNGGFGGFVQLSNSNSPMLGSDDDEDDDEDVEGLDVGQDEDGGGEDMMDTDGSLSSGLEDWSSVNSNQSLGAAGGQVPGTVINHSDDSGISLHPHNLQQQQHLFRRTRWQMMPQLKRLALINIVSPTTHRGTDGVMRSLVSRVNTFLYWNSFNILFPVVRAQYSRLVNLILIEPSEPAWREGTWQEHTAAFRTMKSLETVTWINPHMQRRFLIPILDVMLLSLERLRVIRLVSTEEDEDTQVLQMILTHVLETRWTGHLIVSIQDDLGADPFVRDWSVRAEESVRVANLDDAMKNRPLKFTVKLFRSEWDEDAGLKRLCLKAWQQTI